ncbi:MAG: threonine-phosphate decarboxylase [Selenomonadaceae bacterium]|nr:threonine-phosphate decarboxylase [Selenomonadaceae bacterium]MBQ3726832.1 threonine-phosphate decarboxylase [Selenomonadaceae bacterium]MBQ9498149.1 threonine-phosphate decarboxylase [Selenomonadaceae bacterium]
MAENFFGGKTLERYAHGGQVYDAAGKIGDWLDFSANINPRGLSEKILRTLAENLRGVINYPDPNASELKRAISQRYGVPEKNLVVLNGAAEFFYLYLNVTRPKRVVLPVPSFSEYERAARAASCHVEYFFTRADENFSLDADKLARTNADCVIVGRPNNPTGNLPDADKILRLAQVSSVLVDESFLDFLDAQSLRNFISEKISVVQSLTKIFAIPGLRLGFAVVEENLARRLNLAKDVWNVNFLAQKAGVAALSDEDFLRQTRAWLAAEKKFFAERLSKIRGVEIFPPSVNFILFRHERAQEILHSLRRDKILLRNCANFAGLDQTFLRAAIRSRQDNLRLFNALAKIL